MATWSLLYLKWTHNLKTTLSANGFLWCAMHNLPLARWLHPKWWFIKPNEAFLSGVQSTSFIQQHSFCIPLGGALCTLHETINTRCCDTINHVPPNTQIQYQTQTSHSVSLKSLKSKRSFWNEAVWLDRGKVIVVSEGSKLLRRGVNN